MRFKQLVNTELSIPEISLGAMSLPGDFRMASSIIHSALASGLNLIDSADLYQRGTNEEIIGKAIAGKRNQVLLSSKVGNQWRQDGSGWDWNPSPSYIKQALEASLSRLNTDYLDIYLLHGGTIDDPWDEIFEAFETFKTEGKIRAYGLSSIRPNVVKKIIRQGGASMIMTQYNPLDRRPEETIFPLVRKSNSKIWLRGSLAKGLLLTKPDDAYLSFSKEKVAEIKKIIHQTGYDPQAVLLRFGLSEEAVISISVGISKGMQMERLCRSYELSQAIPDDLIQDLKMSIPSLKYENHRV